MIYKKILMCKPKHFDVIHKNLNIHMKMLKNVNLNKSLNQWNNLTNIFKNNGVNVEYIKSEVNLVDMVFTANGALIYKDKALISKFNAEPRMKESLAHYKYFTHNQYNTYKMITDFEGAGDGLFSHSKKHLWLGYGFRSNQDSKNEIKDIINDNTLNIHSLKLIQQEWYHLDTCFCPFGDNYLILYEKAFDKESLKKIYDVYDYDKCISVSYEDAINFTCNSVCIIDNNQNIILIGHKYSDEFKSKIKNIGYNFIECNMSEFLLSGGSVKCSVLDIDKVNI